MAEIVERAILACVNPITGSQGRTSCVCDLQPTTVDTLIGLRWLPAKRAEGIDAIVTLFDASPAERSTWRRGALDLWNVQRR